nr:hypothetical protein [uncultured Draconibacterium sp.]
MKDFEKEFYSHLGLLSVKFAKMEYNLSLILGKLFGNNDDLITVTLIEKNTLSQNIELLKKINRIRSYEETALNNLIELIGRVKSNRNLFIHGIWGAPFESENDIKIVCDERKIRYVEEKDKNGRRTEQIWYHSKNHIFRLSYLKKQITTINDIILAQESLIKKLEFETFT